MADVEMTECALSNVEQMSQGTMVQRQIEEATNQKILPKVHEFEIEKAEHYTELNKTEVEVMLRIKKADGTNLAPADNVGLINYSIASLFKHFEI